MPLIDTKKALNRFEKFCDEIDAIDDWNKYVNKKTGLLKRTLIAKKIGRNPRALRKRDEKKTLLVEALENKEGELIRKGILTPRKFREKSNKGDNTAGKEKKTYQLIEKLYDRIHHLELQIESVRNHNYPVLVDEYGKIMLPYFRRKK